MVLAQCSVLKGPYTDKHSIWVMIDELFNPPLLPLAQPLTTKSMSAMINELFDLPPLPQPLASSTEKSMSAMIDELFDIPLPANSHTAGSLRSHFLYGQ